MLKPAHFVQNKHAQIEFNSELEKEHKTYLACKHFEYYLNHVLSSRLCSFL